MSLLTILVEAVRVAISGIGIAVMTLLMGRSLETITSLGHMAYTLTGVVLEPVRMAAMTLIYYDLRVRKEGFDFERLAQEVPKGTAPGARAKSQSRPRSSQTDAMSSDHRTSILTPEQIEISYVVARIGARFVALAIDTMYQGLTGFLLSLAVVGLRIFDGAIPNFGWIQISLIVVVGFLLLGLRDLARLRSLSTIPFDFVFTK